MMNQVRMNYVKLMGLGVLLAGLMLHNLNAPLAAAAGASLDINAEIRAVDTYVNDLGKLEKKRLELSKKTVLTRAEFAVLQTTTDDLKRRLSGLKNTLQEVARKLKAAGQWDNLDATVLAKIDDARLQALLRQLSVKQLLDNAATTTSADTEELSQPLDLLRIRVKAQAPETGFASPLSLRPVRAAYAPQPAWTTTSFRCRMSLLRFGLSKAFSASGEASQGSINAGNCFCFDSVAACQAL
jgi:hypothetical protein